MKYFPQRWRNILTLLHILLLYLIFSTEARDAYVRSLAIQCSILLVMMSGRIVFRKAVFLIYSVCINSLLIPHECYRYLHFDFHKICGHVHFERLSILYDQIEDFLIRNRYGSSSNEKQFIIWNFTWLSNDSVVDHSNVS